MSSFSERVSNTLLVASAVTIASVVVIRELRSGPTPSTERQIPAPEFRPEWNEYLSASLELGNSDAPTVLIVFNDFECGGCRLFHERVIGKLRDRGDLSIRLLHLPLRIHRFAPSAARAAECADAQGELHGLVEAIFVVERRTLKQLGRGWVDDDPNGVAVAGLLVVGGGLFRMKVVSLCAVIRAPLWPHAAQSTRISAFFLTSILISGSLHFGHSTNLSLIHI